MTDQTDKQAADNLASENLARALREAEALEAGLAKVFASIEPAAGAAERLLARLAELPFHESQLTLDDAEPYSFEQALRAQTQPSAPSHEGSDLLAAGLEEQPIDEAELDPDEEA